MNKETSSHLKLGIFVAAGTIVLVAALYLIGSKRNVFSSTIKVNAVFYNVNGLMPGNNVRYGGIDVGTVDKIIIENDSTITVRMVIEKKTAPFIKKNAIASIGTDGLMGNKLVNINSVAEPANPIEEGSVLLSVRPVETEEMVRTLNQTNNNLNVITNDLKSLTQKINKQNNLFNILTDTVAAENIRQAIIDFREAAENTNELTNNVNSIVDDIQGGKGLAGTLLSDTSSTQKLKRVLGNLQQISDTLNGITKQLNTFSGNINDTNGLVYSLMKDPSMKNEIKQTLSNVNQSSATLNENMKAMQSHVLFRKYFKDKEKEEKAAKKDSLKAK